MNGTTRLEGSILKKVYGSDIKDAKAFTWNPDPDKYPSLDPTEQYECCINHLLKMSNRVFRYFWFTPELTENGNVHIHGIYEVKDTYKYYNIFLPRAKKHGFLLVKEMFGDRDKWLNYLTKKLELMQELIRDDIPVPYTNINYKEYVYEDNDRLVLKNMMLQRKNKKKKEHIKKSVLDMFVDMDDATEENPLPEIITKLLLFESKLKEKYLIGDYDGETEEVQCED